MLSQRVSLPTILKTGSLETATSLADDQTLDQKAPQTFEWRLVTSINQLQKLQTDWQTLEQKLENDAVLFLTFEWVYNWSKVYLGTDQNARLHILAGYQGEQLVSLWPLQSKIFMGTQHLHWIGDPVSQYGDILIDPSVDTLTCLLEGWQYIQTETEASLMVLRKVRSNAHIMPLIDQLAGHKTCDDSAMSLDFSQYASFDDYMARFSKKEIKNRRRLRRRLEKNGDVSFSLLQSEEIADNLGLVQEAIDLKREWIRENNLVSKAFSDPRLDAFFFQVFKDAKANPGGQLAVLRVGDEIGALMLGFQTGQRFYAHISVINPKFVHDRPGIALVEEFLAWHFEHGTQVFDFLAPADAYKKIWTNSETEINDFTLPIDFGGVVYTHVMIRGVRQTGKKLAAKLPVYYRKHIYSMTKKLLWSR